MIFFLWWRCHNGHNIGYDNVITRHEQKKKILSHATSVGNKQKQTKDRKTFLISNIVSIVSYPSKKTDQNEVNAIQDLLQCSRSSAYPQQKRASTKRGHLIAQVKNESVKWSIKPCIIRTKKKQQGIETGNSWLDNEKFKCASVSNNSW